MNGSTRVRGTRRESRINANVNISNLKRNLKEIKKILSELNYFRS